MELAKQAPHGGEAVWNSFRNANSYAELHYHSNFSRLIRFTDGREMYVKFKLRPYDTSICGDSGKVEPTGILPPETGAQFQDITLTRTLFYSLLMIFYGVRILKVVYQYQMMRPPVKLH